MKKTSANAGAAGIKRQAQQVSRGARRQREPARKQHHDKGLPAMGGRIH
jgi:hypothetical protein